MPKKQNKNLCTVTYKVTKQTRFHIDNMAQTAGISGGRVLDKVFRSLTASMNMERRESLINWKSEAIDELKSYEARKAAIRNLKEKIEAVELDMKSLKAAKTEEASGRGSGDPQDTLLSKIVERDQLKDQLAATERKVAITERCLAALTAEQRMILERFYVSRRQGFVEDLAFELNIEKSMVYNKKNAALKQFTEHMYGMKVY